MALGQRAGWPFLNTFCPSPPLDPARENPEMAPPPHQHTCAPKGSERSRGGHHGGAGLCPTRGARRAAGGERAGSHVRAGRGQPARPRRERPVPLPVLRKDTQRRGGRGRGRLSRTLRGGEAGEGRPSAPRPGGRIGGQSRCPPPGPGCDRKSLRPPLLRSGGNGACAAGAAGSHGGWRRAARGHRRYRPLPHPPPPQHPPPVRRRVSPEPARGSVRGSGGG